MIIVQLSAKFLILSMRFCVLSLKPIQEARVHPPKSRSNDHGQPVTQGHTHVLHGKDLMRSTMWQAIRVSEWTEALERQKLRNEYTALGLGKASEANRLLPEPSPTRLSEQGSFFDVHSYVACEMVAMHRLNMDTY